MNGSGSSPNVPAPEKPARHHLLIVATIAVVHLVPLIRLPFTYVHEDFTALWTVVDDLSEGRLYQIDFVGQHYGSSLEAFPAVLLTFVGVSTSNALAIAMVSFLVVSWAVLAAAIWRRGLRWLALSTVLIPALLSTHYSGASLMWATAAPRALAMFAVAASLGIKRPGLRWLSTATLAGVAMVFDTSTALVLAPLVVWMLIEARRSIPWGWGLLGSVTPVAIFVARHLHHEAHPGYDLHPAPDMSFSSHAAAWHLRNPVRSLRTFGPEVVQFEQLQMLTVIGVMAGLAYVVWTRDRWSVRVALAVAAVCLALFYVTEGSLRSAENFSVVISTARGLMALPILVVFLIVASARPGVGIDSRRSFGIVASLVIVGLVFRGFGGGVDDFEAALIADEAVDVWRTDDLISVCENVDRSMAELGAEVAISGRAAASYGCTSLAGRLVLFPQYERRIWHLTAAIGHEQEQWVLVTHVGDECPDRVDDNILCARLGPGVSKLYTGLVDIQAAAVMSGSSTRWLPR